MAARKKKRTRPAFNPALVPMPADESAPARADGGLTVTRLAELIDSSLKATLPARLRVVGEISGFNDRTHWYFQLKDENACISCVMFASAAARSRLRPRDGHEVLATGRVEHYAKQGRTQLYVESIEPIGAGALEQRLRALCDELGALGWFDEARKRPLPQFPRRIAVVTSKTGAALHDVLDTLRRRSPAIEIYFVDVRVQGAQAAPEIARALNWLSRERQRLALDVVLLTRGGGSIEDLWAFNERIVAEAIVRSAVPVVAAIGHETDTTVAELVADLRAATPTQAAVRIAPDRAALEEFVERSGARMLLSLTRRIDAGRARLRGVERSPIFTRPRALLAEPSRAVAHGARRLSGAANARLARARLRLERASGRLARCRPEALSAARAATLAEVGSRLHHTMRCRLLLIDLGSRDRALARAWSAGARRRADLLTSLEKTLTVAGPPSVLRRGYSVTTRAGGAVVRSTADVAPGEPLRTHVIDGVISSVVDDGPAAPHQRPAPAAPARRRASGAGAPAPEPGLFGA